MSRPLRALAALLIAVLAFGAPVQAQDTNKIINTPAEKFLIAPGGVDMRTGRYGYSETDLTGGGGQGALALTRIMPERVGNHANPFGNFSHNWDVFMIETPSLAAGDDTVRVNVHYGGRSLTFESKASIETYAYAFKSDGPQAFLTYTGSRANGSAIHTMVGPDGTLLVFRAIGGEDCADEAWGSGRRRCAFASEMIEPDGTRYTFDYVGIGGVSGNRARLAKVTSSRGYALLLEGSGNLVDKACLFNLALAPAPAAGAACPAGALAAAAYSYTGAAAGRKLASATPAGGGASTFTYGPGSTIGFVKPGQAQPWLTNTIAILMDEEGALQEIVSSQAFAGGQTYAYAWGTAPVTNDQSQGLPTANTTPNIAGGSYTDAEQRKTIVRFDFPLHPNSGPTNRCLQPPCELDPPWDGFMNWIYQQTPGPVEIRDPLGRTMWIDYCDPVATHCSVGRMQSSTDPEGIKTKYEYDGRGNVSKATRFPKPGVLNPDGSTPAPIVLEAAYATANPKTQTKPLWTKDGNGNVTSYTYSPVHGGVLTETGPAVNGVTPQKRYSYAGRQARLWNGAPTGSDVHLLDRMSYCRTGNPGPGNAGCALGAADEVVTSYDYGADGGPTNLLLRGQAVTADGQTLRTCYAYDAQGRKISETSPNGTAALSACPGAPPATVLPFTASTRYDPDGRVTGTIAPDPDGAGGNGHPAVRNTYDPAGRLVKVEQGVLADWLSEAVTPSAWSGFTVHKVLESQYDALDRKVRESVRGGPAAPAVESVTEYSYDLRGLLKCTAVRMNRDAWSTPLPDKCEPGPAHATLGPDRLSRNIYDAAGQLIQVQNGLRTNQARTEATYTYNRNGQKLSLSDARGFMAEVTYDGHGRQSRWIFPSKTTPGVANAPTASNPGDYEQYLYDPAGNRTSLRKRDGSVLTFQYDALNRVTAKISPERVGLTPAQTRDVHYEYDLRGLQTKARFDSLAGEGVTTAYDGFGRVTSSTITMSGVSRSIGHLYDADGNRIRITHPDTTFFTYEYDGLGRFRLARENGGNALVTFAYDAAGRRSGLTSGGTASSYGYDGVGRLQSLNHNLAGTSGDQTIGLAYNPASQIVTRTGINPGYVWNGARAVNRTHVTNGLNQYTAAGSATLGYDLNGNLTSVINPPYAPATYIYDVENRLVSSSGASSATLTYDPLGRLWEVSSSTLGTTRFLYDDDALIAEYDSSGYMHSRYLHGAEKGTDDPLIWYDNPNSGWRRALVADQQGSIIAVTDMYGNPIAINAYDEYGIAKDDSNGAPGMGNRGRFQYTGQAWLAEIGMYYYKARIYSPTLGRFMQVDPIGYDDQINLYAYVGNDPINGTDPTGMCNPAASRICAERERQLKAAREEGVRKAWAAERKLVEAGGGTRAWTRAERAELLSTGKVKGYQGHHINTVKGNPIELARNPNNIRFVTHTEHVQIHREAGGYRKPITGKPMVVRSLGIFNVLTSITGTMSGRLRTDNLGNFVSDLFGFENPVDTYKRDLEFCRSQGFDSAYCT